MPTPPSDDTRTLFRLISDGQWHKYEEVRDRIAETVPPGRALRKYQETINYKRKYRRDPTYDTQISEGERIFLGSRACGQIVITSWKGRGVESKQESGQRWIRVREGFTAWGLEAEGIPGPRPGDSEPSAGDSVTPERASGSELNPSHERVTLDERSGLTTCPGCKRVVVTGGITGMVTKAGRRSCPGQASAADEPVCEPVYDIPTIELIPEPEVEFTARISEVLGDASVRAAIAKAEDYFRLDEAAEEALQHPEPEPQPAPVEPQEIARRALLAAGIPDPTPSPTVVAEHSVMTAAEEPPRRAPLSDAEPRSQEAEMALFRESEVRHLLREEISKAVDAFQLGMQQYLDQQFDQLSQQIAVLRSSRGKWVYHPLKD